MPLTPFFAAVFGLLYIFLSLNVVRHRLGKGISIGAGDDKAAEYAIRTHANFIEYVPLALLLFYFIEMISLSSVLVFYLGSALVVARVMHIIGMLDPKNWMILRQIGTVGTFSIIIVASCALALRYIPISV